MSIAFHENTTISIFLNRKLTSFIFSSPELVAPAGMVAGFCPAIAQKHPLRTLLAPKLLCGPLRCSFALFAVNYITHHQKT